MDNEYNEVFHSASHYPRMLTTCNRGENPSFITEDEEITVPLSPARPVDSDSAESEDQTRSLSGSTLRLGRGDAHQLVESEPCEQVNEIELGGLRAADQILIETAQSVYIFTVIDPTMPSGRLTGGILGNRLVDAYLLLSHEERNASRFTHKSLTVGEKFAFLIESGDNVQRLTTSTVTRLLHRKKGGRRVGPASKRRVRLEHVSCD